jgi:hypothetical protein
MSNSEKKPNPLDVMATTSVEVPFQTVNVILPNGKEYTFKQSEGWLSMTPKPRPLTTQEIADPSIVERDHEEAKKLANYEFDKIKKLK